MFAYDHKVSYYETDKMGIVHHSNYVRWMEEARCALLEDIGWSFKRLEEMGIGSPVTAVSAEFKSPAYFADTVTVEVGIESFNGVRLKVKYTIKNAETGRLLCRGATEHCFLDEKGTILRADREYPEFYAAIMTHKI